jgi:ATP-binding cassette subfamily F protein 3
MRAKDVLLEALEKFTGTVVFVSHDRYFIDKLATRVFEIGGGEVNVFPGNYEDYLWRKEGKEIDLTLPGLPDLVAERAVAHHARDGKHAAAQPAPVPAAKSKKVNPLRLQQMKDRCREIEEQVARLEAEIEGYGQESAHFKSAEESVRLAKLAFKAGNGTNTEVLDAELDLFRSRAGIVRAQMDAAEALLNLESALGRRLAP